MATRVSEAIPRDELRFEPTEKWVRAEVDGAVVVDSRGAMLVWEPGNVVPGYAFPLEDVRLDLLPVHPEPFTDDELAGYVAVPWDAMDRWLEEEEEIVGHPRDPFHRVDVRRSSRHVEVLIEGETVADTRRPHLLFETGLPVRYYMPREDVRTELLVESHTHTYCAYKGKASYWSVRVGGELYEDVVWTYPEPLPDNRWIQGLVAFFQERTDIVVDGESVGRPQTQWSLVAR